MSISVRRSVPERSPLSARNAAQSRASVPAPRYWRAFACHGARIGVGANADVVLDDLARRLPVGWGPAFEEPSVWYRIQVARRDGRHRIFRGSEPVGAANRLDDLLERLESLLHFEAALRSRDRVFVHAGVVGVRGLALVLPGRSRSGKTTLVSALVDLGATYYSDEYAVLDPAGSVHPYPKRLCIRQPGRSPVRMCSVESLGGHAATAPGRVGLVASLRYRRDAVWTMRSTTPGQTCLGLVANTVSVRQRPRFTTSVLGAAVVGSAGIEGVRGDAAAAAKILMTMLLALAGPADPRDWRPGALPHPNTESGNG